MGKIRASNLNIGRAVKALDAGAQSGPFQKLMPSIRAASVQLDQAQTSMGLDVIGAVTFGALSKGELDLALQNAVPTGLDEVELRKWLINKQIANNKLAEYYADQIEFIDEGGTVAGFVRRGTSAGQPIIINLDSQGNIIDG